MRSSYAYLLGGFLVGCFVGFKILPGFPLFTTSGPDVEVPEVTAARADVARQIETDLTLASDIERASVQLTRGAASVTLTLSGEGVSGERLAVIAAQVSTAAGIAAGEVSIFDSRGKYLNRRSIEEYEQETWWRGKAILVAKVLGILAACVTMKFIIDTIRGTRSSSCCAPFGWASSPLKKGIG